MTLEGGGVVNGHSREISDIMVEISTIILEWIVEVIS